MLYTAGMRRKVEIFTAGCPFCADSVQLVRSIACPSCDVEVLDIHKAENAAKARRHGVRQVPAVVVDGKAVSGLDEASLRAAGVGVPLWPARPDSFG